MNYRCIQVSDRELIFEWNNDVQTRLNSFQTETILKETHDIWFLKKINDENAFYLIVEFENQPFGLVRYDVSDHTTTVGINFSNKTRGKGLSSIVLKETAQLYFSKFDKPILAYIKPSNLASIKAFEKAGYLFEKEEIVLNQKALVYKLEKGILQA